MTSTPTAQPPVHRLDVRVERLDVADPDALERAFVVLDAAERHERPWAYSWSLGEFTGRVRASSETERIQAWVATAGGEVLGVALVELPLLDNVTMAWPMVWVHPENRGRGVGSALLGLVLDECRRAGRSTVLLETSYPDSRREDHPYRRFAEKHGFALANTEVLRILDLPVAPALLQRLAAEAAERHTAYTIASFVAPLPEELQESYCAACNLLGVDAPTGDVDFEAEVKTPVLYREEIARLAEQGRTMLTTVALDAEGRVVAYNDLVVPRDDVENVLQWGTLVRAEHRGHRLGMAVKVRGLQELARRYPDRRRVHTCNAEQNAHMVDINVELGFVRVETVGLFQRVQD